jgi:hypothetical protein
VAYIARGECHRKSSTDSEILVFMATDLVLRHLVLDEYPIWNTLVEASPQGSVFCRSWWLNAVGSTRILGCFRGRDLVAGVPLHERKRFGLTLCTMPKLTTWGPVLERPAGNSVKAASREMEILRLLADHLSRKPFVLQKFHPTLGNWLPFYWKGFVQRSRCTNVIEHLTDLNSIWAGMADNIRREIRKAERRGISVFPCSVDELYTSCSQMFQRRREYPAYSKEYLARLVNAARENASGECFAARDADGRTHAALFLVWDKKEAYYLTGGSEPALRTSGATSLLTWHALQFSARCTASFNFGGSMVERIDQFFRAFGGKQVLFNLVVKAPTWLRLCCECSSVPLP